MFEFQPNRIGTVVDRIGEAVEHRNNSMEVAIAINRNRKYMKDIYICLIKVVGLKTVIYIIAWVQL